MVHIQDLILVLILDILRFLSLVHMEDLMVVQTLMQDLMAQLSGMAPKTCQCLLHNNQLAGNHLLHHPFEEMTGLNTGVTLITKAMFHVGEK